MLKRIITGFALFGLLVFLIMALPSNYFIGLTGVFILFGVWEWTRLMGLTHCIQRCLYCGMMAILMFVVNIPAWQSFLFYWMMSLALLWWCAAIYVLRHYSQGKLAPFDRRWLVGLIGLLIFLPFYTAIIHLQPQYHGRQLIVALVLITASIDTGGYFAGRFFGKRALAPVISPKKTIEGVFGGVLLMWFFVLVSQLFLQFNGLHFIYFALIATLTGLFSIVGDLIESVFKRIRGVKDSGNLLPGHGGLLDRIDGFTASVPIYVIGLSIAGIIS